LFAGERLRTLRISDFSPNPGFFVLDYFRFALDIGTNAKPGNNH